MFTVAVLDRNMTYTPLGVNQSDAQYIESRQFTAEEVARFTGIPKHMLQTGKESYDSNAQQRQNYVTDTLLPYVVQWEQEDGYKAIPPAKRDGEGWYMRGNVAVLLRGDDLTRSQVSAPLFTTRTSAGPWRRRPPSPADWASNSWRRRIWPPWRPC